MKILASLVVVLCATAAFAQDGIRTTDTTMNGLELTALISGQTLEFYDGSKSTYQENGRYGYTYTDDGQVWAGTYRAEENSEVCVVFDTGSERCDALVLAGDRLVLVTSEGLRFPVRNITVAGQ